VSEVGTGTRFRITLPRSSTLELEAHEAKVNETSRGGHAARNPGAVG